MVSSSGTRAHSISSPCERRTVDRTHRRGCRRVSALRRRDRGVHAPILLGRRLNPVRRRRSNPGLIEPKMPDGRSKVHDTPPCHNQPDHPSPPAEHLTGRYCRQSSSSTTSDRHEYRPHDVNEVPSDRDDPRADRAVANDRRRRKVGRQSRPRQAPTATRPQHGGDGLRVTSSPFPRSPHTEARFTTSSTRPERDSAAPRGPLSRSFGADDGIRTRDPHLGKDMVRVHRVLSSPRRAPLSGAFVPVVRSVRPRLAPTVQRVQLRLALLRTSGRPARLPAVQLPWPVPIRSAIGRPSSRAGDGNGQRPGCR